MPRLHQRSRRWSLAVGSVASLAVLGLAACGSGGSSGDGATPPSVTQRGSGTPSSTAAPGAGDGGAQPSVAGETAVVVDQPTDLVVRPDDDDLWVAERPGTIRRLTVSDDGATLRPDGDPVLDLSDDTTLDGERGLLGIEFSADGNTLFTSSTDRSGNTRIARYPIEGDAVDPGAATELFTVEQPFSNHNGGHLRFGPDGKLWLGLGDGGSGDDPDNRAQDPSTPLGKMIRIDPESGAHEIVMSGLRNPWRFSFDTDDSLWIGDVGESSWEEIDHLAPGDIDGANLGWSGREGTHENANVDPDGRTGADPVDPVFDYSHDGGNCSITGGFVYRGQAMADLQGAYLFTDFCAGRIRAIRLDDSGRFATEYDLGVDVDNPVSFAADADGEPYVLSNSGDIVRLTPA